MHRYDVDSLRPVAGERYEQRLREADAGRLARAIRATGQRRRRLRLRAGLALGATHLLRLRRLES